MLDSAANKLSEEVTLNDCLEKYRNRIVRDLIWCIASPTIMAMDRICRHPEDSLLLNWVIQAEEKLARLDENPLPLINFISRTKTNRLGEKFERFWHFWLSECQGKKVVAADYQVQLKDRTLGAFDLLVDESHTSEDNGLENQSLSRFQQTIKSRLLSHYELTVKFYLNSSHGSRMSDWYGPDQSDRLDKKINRMVEHQLKLSQYPATEKLLQQKRWQIEKIYGICKGRLFWNAFTKTTTLPEWINPQVELGFWCPASQFKAVQKQQLLQWYLLDKNDWFAPLNQKDVAEMGNLDERELQEHIQKINRVVQIAGYDPVYNREQIRGFIVPDEWLVKLKEVSISL